MWNSGTVGIPTESEGLLARESLTHGEIAFLLGYSEESAFSRAYKS